MFKLLLIFIIRFDVLIAPHSSETRYQQRNTLPFVLIRTEDGQLIRPTDIPLPLIGIRGNFFFGTKFSAVKKGKQLFFCGAPPPEGNTSSADGDGGDDKYILHELLEPTVGSHYLTCSYEPEPYVLKLTEKNDADEEKEVHCGSEGSEEKKNRMYAFAYKVKTNDDNKTHNFEVYKFCYEETEGKVLFTAHTVASPKLLNSPVLKQEQEQLYGMSVNAYHYFGTRFQTIIHDYAEFLEEKKMNKWNDKLVAKSKITFKSELKDEKLVPPEDMAFALWRKTTFHILNASLMEDEKIDLWENISYIIRHDAKEVRLSICDLDYGKTSREYLVYTGTFDITDEGKEKNESIQSPDFWIKIVQYENENDKEPDASIAIVMIHNPKIESVVETFTNICKENVCKNAFVEAFPTIGTSVCCTTSMAKVDHYFGLNLYDHQPLKIKGLYTIREEALAESHELPTEVQEVPEKIIGKESSSKLPKV